MKLAKLIAGLALALVGAAGLVACNGGNDEPVTSAPADPGTPATVTDAFFGAVSAAVANSRDDTEPLAIDGQTVTTPESSEPQPVG